MKEKLLAAGFIEDVEGMLHLEKERYTIAAWHDQHRWMYTAKDKRDGVTYGPQHLMNITQLNPYL